MTKKDKIQILILDDEKEFTEELAEFFNKSGYVAFEANTEEEAKEILGQYEIDLLILDVRLPGVNGLDILKDVKIRFPSIEVILVSAHGDMDTVIKAMRLGAFDYLRKPFRHIDIQMVIERTQKFLHIQRRLKWMEEKNSLISKNLQEKINRQLIGVSPQIQEVYEQAIIASEYPDANVLITGESGTGKENIARIIHYSSERKDHIFSAINASAISESLLESEFFGHKKGSFTGAVGNKMGFFELCNKGTLFLDEIADMPINLQAKILRATEEKVITRVGDTTQISTDFRIISATNQNIEKRVEEKKFRLDLLHRLNTLRIHIPPLRERPEDVSLLLTHFVDIFTAKFNKPNIHISEEVFEMLRQYDFPGNVRELRNLAERAVILCKGEKLTNKDFPLILKKPRKAVPKSEVEEFNLKNQEVKLIRKALEECSYNQKAAAELLGITRDALIRRMKKYNISVDRIMK